MENAIERFFREQKEEIIIFSDQAVLHDPDDEKNIL
jgi:hypothetical protein